MKKIASFILAAAAITLAAPASAQFAKPEDAIKYRKAALTVMATHFGRVAAMANGRVPFDARAAADNAAIAEAMSKLPWAGFVEGSDKGDTKAKADIWSDSARFKDANEKCRVRSASSLWRPVRAAWTTSRRRLAPRRVHARPVTMCSVRIDVDWLLKVCYKNNS